MQPQANSVPPDIPDYTLLRMVGQGSYGDVWLARGITGLYRAVKIVWRNRFEDPEPYEREFKGLREFAAISLLEARQLALLHIGRNDSDGFFYYVMELADDADSGCSIDPCRYQPHTLKEARRRRGRIPTSQVIGLGTNLARALAGLHARGLVHRDVKPSNVIFVGGEAKLADIGLVTISETAGNFVGTEGFVPPEGTGTAGADVFGLGKLLYEAATGLDRNEYPRLPSDLAALPDRKMLLELNEILVRACEPKSGLRYPDGSAILDDLLTLHAGNSLRAQRAAEHGLRRAARVLAFVGLAAMVAGTGALAEQYREHRGNDLQRLANVEREVQASRILYSAGLATAQIAISRDGRWLATGDTDGRLRIWDRTTRKMLHELKAHGQPIRFIAIAHDGESIVTSAADGHTRVWGTWPGSMRAEWTSSVPALMAAFSPTDRWLAVGLENGDVEIRAFHDSEIVRILHTGGPHAAGLAFSSDGKRLVSVGAAGLFYVYAVEDWRELATLTAAQAQSSHSSSLDALTFCTDIQALVSNLADRNSNALAE